MFEAMLDQVGNGLVLGSVIALTAVGLSLIFGVTGIVNFAHGDLVTLGAVIALWLVAPVDRIPGANDLPLWLAIGLTILIGFAVGALLELGLMRPLRKRHVGGVTMLIVTIGLSFVIRYLILIWIGGSPYRYPLPVERQQTYLGFINMTPRDLVLVLITVVILGSVGLFLTYTRLGTAMRAISDNEDLAESSGIDAAGVYVATWAVGISLAFTGGVFQGLIVEIRWTMGFSLLLLMFAAVILGGIGNPFGAMVGGYVIGLVTTLSTALPFMRGRIDLRFAVALLVMIIVLMFRPQGILGAEERIS